MILPLIAPQNIASDLHIGVPVVNVDAHALNTYVCVHAHAYGCKLIRPSSSLPYKLTRGPRQKVNVYRLSLEADWQHICGESLSTTQV